MLKIPHYLEGKLSHGFVSLFTGRMIQFAAQGLIGLFVPMFLYVQFDYNVIYVFYYYIIGSFFYALFLPLGARVLNKYGLRRSLQTSVFFDAAFFCCFLFYDRAPIFFLILSLVFQFFSRTLFWLPYNVDLAKFTAGKDRGKEMGMIFATKSFLAIIMPIFAGFLLNFFGNFDVVFSIAIVIYLLAGIPFIKLPHTRERYSWSYAKTVKKFFKKENRGMVLGNMADGAENAAALIIWPIFIWEILNGDYLAAGGISSLIVFVTVIIQLFVGKYVDIFSKRRMLHWGSLFYAVGWFMKVFVVSALHIFVIGAYHKFAQVFKDTPFSTLNYEYIADQGHYVDEYTVLREMSSHFGRSLVLILAVVVSFSFGLNWTFALAALASLLINLL